MPDLTVWTAVSVAEISTKPLRRNGTARVHGGYGFRSKGGVGTVLSQKYLKDEIYREIDLDGFRSASKNSFPHHNIAAKPGFCSDCSPLISYRKG